MVKSNTKIKKQLGKKTNSRIIETILEANKHKNWKRVAEILSGPRKNRANINLSEIKESCVVVGKVLSQGEINKKIKVVALGFSEKAKEKLKKADCELSILLEEIKKNPEMKGLEIHNTKFKNFTLPKLNKETNLNK